jgi:hypothetical protein
MERLHIRWLFTCALCALLLGTLSGCGGSAAELDAALLRLELRYPVAGDPDLRITGQEASAPRGSTVSCRTTGDDAMALGRVAANENGSFEISLDADAYPMNALTGDFMALNSTVECRADGGPWVSPLRPPLVAIG